MNVKGKQRNNWPTYTK